MRSNEKVIAGRNLAVRRIAKKDLLLVLSMPFVAALMGASFNPLLCAQSTPMETKATLKGVVTAPGGAVIGNATLLIADPKTERRIVSDQDGSYSIDLPPGSYLISSDIPHYFPYRRARVCLKPGTVTIVNVRPLLRDVAHVLAVPPIRGGLVTASPAKYESVSVPSGCSPLLIEFDKRRPQGRFIEYTGVVASLDTLIINADRMLLNRRTLALVADGDDVIVEDGKRQLHVRHVEANLKTSDPLASLKTH